MKRILTVILAVIFTILLFAGCASVKYKKGVDFDGFPDRDIPIYDDAIVYSYDEHDDKYIINFGTEDDIEDIMSFYQEELINEDYTITEEEMDKDEYSIEGYNDDYEFEIEAEEANDDMQKYFDTVVRVYAEGK